MIPVDTYNEDFQLGSHNNFSGKETKAYGNNWISSMVGDDSEAIIGIMGKFEKEPEDISIEVLVEDDEIFLLVTSCDWSDDFIYPVDYEFASFAKTGAVLIYCNLTSDPVAELSKTLSFFEQPIKEEMKQSLSNMLISDVYIDNSYPKYVQSLLNNAALSHADRLVMAKDFNPKFIKAIFS